MREMMFIRQKNSVIQTKIKVLKKNVFGFLI